MPRRRDPISAIRTVLYGLGKFLGDVQAVRKGPSAIVKRLARREAGRFTARVLGKLFR
jgi:hypothetical protein